MQHEAPTPPHGSVEAEVPAGHVDPGVTGMQVPPCDAQTLPVSLVSVEESVPPSVLVGMQHCDPAPSQWIAALVGVALPSGHLPVAVSAMQVPPAGVQVLPESE